MGQKIHPRNLRLGIIEDWDSTWYASGNYSDLVLEDFKIRQKMKDALNRAGISKILIKRKSNSMSIIVYVARTGIIFGKSSIDLELLKQELIKEIGIKSSLNIKILEQKNPEGNAKLIADWIATQLEKRVPFRRAMKMAIQKALKSGVEGVKVETAGRLGGAEIARSEGYREGKIPLHTIRAQIDYAFTEALTTYGKIGVKVWINNGETFKRYNEYEQEEVKA